MIDSLLEHVQLAQSSGILENLGLRQDGCLNDYAVLTLHRPSNVDEPGVLRNILSAINELSDKIPVVFPVHPRTASKLRQFRLHLKSSQKKVIFCPPLGYLDFLCLVSNAKLVLTDSGGIQEETTILKIPCLTLRDNTERPITVTAGTNHIVGNNPAKILRTASEVLEKKYICPKNPPLWDGRAAERIIRILTKR
jgi:UDP-N-acetylglucosamine 2-epimerase (non-hydrolysing)